MFAMFPPAPCFGPGPVVGVRWGYMFAGTQPVGARDADVLAALVAADETDYAMARARPAYAVEVLSLDASTGLRRWVSASPRRWKTFRGAANAAVKMSTAHGPCRAIRVIK